MAHWIDACATADIDEEDLILWVHDGHTYAIYHTAKGFFPLTECARMRPKASTTVWSLTV